MIGIWTCCDGVMAWPADVEWLTAGNVRYTRAAVHQVLGHTILEAPISCDSELIVDGCVGGCPAKVARNGAGLGLTHIVTGSDEPCSKVEWQSTVTKKSRAISRPSPRKLCLISIKLEPIHCHPVHYMYITWYQTASIPTDHRPHREAENRCTSLHGGGDRWPWWSLLSVLGEYHQRSSFQIIQVLQRLQN